MVKTSEAQTRMQQEQRRKEYKAMVERVKGKHAIILQAAKDRVPNFHEKQEAYDIARGAYDSDTFLRLPDMSEQRRVLVEIAGFPAAASDFTDAQVKDLYKSHIKKVKKAMEMEIAAPVVDEEIVLDDGGFFDLGEEE